MQELSLKIISKAGETLAVSRGKNEVNLVYVGEYEFGDRIVLETEKSKNYMWLQVDDGIGKSLVYLTGNLSYRIPFGQERNNLSPKAFTGKKHLISARIARDFEIDTYRNLAYNCCDQHEIENLFPHAIANVETRGESVFAAQNAIDGITVNNCHGEWPYSSWGINQQKDAVIKINFGREILTDRILLYLRADFPHDNWWKEVTFNFSDGSSLTADLKKTSEAQEIRFENKKITWISMNEMKKSEEPSPFPALTQIEVYGRESKGGIREAVMEQEGEIRK